MTEFRTRIGRVIRKGGADVKIIDGKFEWHGPSDECRERLEAGTAAVLGFFPDLAGFVVIGWDMQGRYSLGYRNDAKSVPHRLMSTFVKECLDREMLVGDLVQDIREGLMP